ncbi:hypothetical protein JCM9533A_50960 [Catenuloplanes niger JCM 9533]
MVRRQALGDVRLDQREPRIVGEVTEVVLGAGDEVVHRHDRATTADQRIDKVRRDEAGSAGDENPVALSETLGNDHGARL